MVKKFLTFVALCMAIISNTNAETSASAIASKKQTLFSSVNHEEEPYRIPAIATLNNGTVLAIADQRPCGADIGNGEVDIYAKVGTINANGTYSWNPASIDPSEDGGLKIAEGTSSNGYGDAAVVVDRESGKVLVICVAGNVKYSSGTSSKHNKMARIVGSADGLTWEDPQDVSSAFFANELSSAATMFMASGKMVQSQLVKVGNYYRIYGALLVLEKKNIFSTAVEKNYVVYSDDFGVTWKVLGGGAAVSSSANEAKVEELPNGDIVLSSRTSGGRIFNVFNFTNLNNAEGSWGSATKYSFAGGNSTNGELKLYKGLVDANGTEYNVMFQSLPIGSSDREKVSVYYKAFATNKSSWAVSDFTSNWTKGIQVDDGASAYSTMTILPNGQIGFLYEDDYDTSKADGDYFNIVYVPLTVEEMTGGAFSLPAKKETVKTPTFSPAGGEIQEGATVAIACATEGATIYYTTNGSTPTTSSTKYTGAIIVNSAMTIKAIAAKEGNYINSEVATASYTIKAREVVATPVINPAGGEILEGTSATVTITCATEGAAIYYTTDGTEPTKSSTSYTGAITVNSATTIKAIAVKDGYYTDSEVATVTFTIKNLDTVSAPTFNPAGGEIEEGASVAIACATEGATIYYTTNGDEPTTASAVYSSPIVVDEAMTIKAIAVKDGHTDSEVATASYTIKQSVVTKEYSVTPIAGNIGDTEYYLATFSATKATVAPADVKVFYVKESDNTEPISLVRAASGKAIPANTGVILMASSSNEFKMTVAAEGTPEADFSGNYLKGTLDVANFKFNKENCYALVVKGSGELQGLFAFSKVPVDTELNGYNNRAYLDLSSSKAFSNNFRLSFGGVTGIEPVAEEETEEVIFDLRGRRVTEMEPGKIYIINGKKVLKK